MASFRKAAGGRWRAEVARKGVRRSGIFDTKQMAKDWAAREEFLISQGAGDGSRVILREVFERYAREVSPLKRGERWEVIRLKRFCADRIAKLEVGKVAAADVADWRDRRLREVSNASVSREMNLMSGVFTVARQEWGLIGVNPMSDVRKPRKPPPRDRRVTDRELEALAISAGGDLSTATGAAFHAFLFAIETGMRAGEIVGLCWCDVNLETRVATLPLTKNGTGRRVPLSARAVELIEALPAGDPVFGLASPQLDALWRKLRDRAGVVGLTFHDSRHEAITRLARKLDVLDLARMVGHRDLKMLQVYYNATAEEIAGRLD